MSAGKVLQLHGEAFRSAPAGDDRHREPVAAQVDSRPNPHDHDLPGSSFAGPRSGMGRHATTVIVAGAPGLPSDFWTIATMRALGSPPTIPSASIRNVLLPTVTRRPLNRPGTVG